jgi:hypothetical protein
MSNLRFKPEWIEVQNAPTRLYLSRGCDMPSLCSKHFASRYKEVYMAPENAHKLN